jgi:hypothetical protein
MSIGHDSGPANDVMGIVGVQARQARMAGSMHSAHARPLRRAPRAVGRYSDHRRLIGRTASVNLRNLSRFLVRRRRSAAHKCDKLRPRRATALAQQALHVLFDSANRQRELGSDVPVGEALSH